MTATRDGRWIEVRYEEMGQVDLYRTAEEGSGIVCCVCRPEYELPRTEDDGLRAFQELRRHVEFHAVDRETYVPLERALAEVGAA